MFKPHSKPSLTSRASSLKRLRLSNSPVKMTTLSRNKRRRALRRTKPAVTMQPAIEPILLTLNTSRISAVPKISSFLSGVNMPDMAALSSSTAS